MDFNLGVIKYLIRSHQQNSLHIPELVEVACTEQIFSFPLKYQDKILYRILI